MENRRNTRLFFLSTTNYVVLSNKENRRLMYFSFLFALVDRIYDLCFSADGSQLIAAAGNKVLVYETSTGTLLHSLKGT